MSDTDRENAFAGKIRYVDYGIPETALRKWAANCLSCLHDEGGKRRYRFTFEGSTCMDGGAPYTANMQILLDASARSVMVEDALIFFAEEDREAASQMCEFGNRGEAFFAGLQSPASFCGRSIEDILAEPVPVNPAGCFCTEPMVNHKWRLALSTVHYALAQEAGG